MSDVNEGQLINITHPPTDNNIKWVCWKTKDGEIIPINLLRDSHLRNIALFLMDMGYTNCIADKNSRIIWLTVLAIEWKRRMKLREHKMLQSTELTYEN